MSEPLEDEFDDTPPPDDDKEHPSTLGLLCTEPEPPQVFEVMQRLERAGHEVEVVTEDAWEGVVWARVLRLDNSPHPVRIWCQPRSAEFKPWEWTAARWRDEEEFEATRRARWMLMIQTTYEPDDEPNDHYHAHLKLADIISDGLATAVIDTNAMSLRSKTTLHDLATCPVAPAPEELYEIHVVKDEDTFWLHTHGLRRFEVPELEVIGVPRDRFQDTYTAFQWLIAYVLPVYIPAKGLELSFGSEVNIRLIPWDEVVAQLPSDGLGGANDRDNEEHAGWRLVVSDQGERYSINGFLESVQGDPIFWLSDEESARRAHLAQVRFGHAAAAWYSTQFSERRMGVKVGVPFTDERKDLYEHLQDEELPKGASREHMWFELLAIEGKTLIAKLDSEPVYATYMTKGDTYRLPINQLSEFNLMLDGDYYNPATITELDQVTLRTGIPRH